MDIDEFRKKFFVDDGKVVSRKKNKYRNQKVEVDGITFHSRKEANFYSDLLIKKNAKLITDFEKQVQYDIRVNDIHIAKYFLDFKVINLDGSINYYDVKGKDKVSGKWITTDVFALKKKLVEAIYGIKIEKI
jgi:hypothetical protein